MNMSKKLPVLFGLCLAFAVVLTIIYSLVGERMDYASAVLNINQSSDRSGINDYRMIARSIKYGMLLVIFTFAVFFLYEVLHKWRIHPMQYLLVGGALSECLKTNGVMYLSFKYGDRERLDGERLFCDLNEKRLSALVSTVPELQIKETWMSEDRRKNNNNVWLNTLLKKST